MSRALHCLLVLILFVPALALATGDAARGRKLWDQKCATCHERSSMGPPFRKIHGQGAGRVPGFAYTEALEGSSITWTDEALDKWLADPDKFVPGNRMGFKTRNAAERADLIEYLRTRS
jgi:cytochrome c